MHPKWVPNGRDEATGDPMEALGPNGNMLPLDRNVTFFFDYLQGWSCTFFVDFLDFTNNFYEGTIEYFDFINITASIDDPTALADIDLGSYRVTDKFNARDFRVSITFYDVRTVNNS